MINMTITRQQPSSSVCPTIKSNARLRRSRKWRDQQSNNGENTNNTNKSTASKRKNIRRRPSSMKDVDDSSSISCASTASMSTTSFDSCASPPTKKSNNRSSSRNQSTKKNKKSTRRRPTPKVIFAELTPEEKSNYLAIDCEMVGIGPSGYTSRLARVSIVNYDGEIVYDTHVKVDEPVTDYRTFVSGITAEDLSSESGAVSFDEAQSQVTNLIQDKILVGHGLKNDFKVLGISHPWYLTRDTAKYEPFCKVPGPNDYNPTNAQFIPKKLKVLAKDKLGMIIQEEGKCHCPVEDAVAALELYKKHSGKWEKVIEYKLSKTREIMTGSQ